MNAMPPLPRPARSLKGKYLGELSWWKDELTRLVAWYQGEEAEFWDVPAPKPDQKRSAGSLPASAALTFLALFADYYPKALAVSRDHFAEKTILDVGCGPLPFSIAFNDCRRIAMDPLVDDYLTAGFPLDVFWDRVMFIRGFAEDMPFPSRFFDAVISVNAIDHVDDVAAAAHEITRVLKPEGIVRMQVHYHRRMPLEPQSLSDSDVLAHFGHLGVRKVSERAPTRYEAHYPEDRDEKLVVWGNEPVRA